ncbi:MAG: hypothetical protein JNM72_02645 [Deltaproteobacteria bacterium]|nr:hypothetical protein [Deltaproteobacteria bacterium]
MASLALALLGALALLSLGDLRAAPWPGVGLLLLWGGSVAALRAPRGGPGAVLLAALALRGLLLWGENGLSDDVHRYVWEGRVVAMGESPFVHPPADPYWAADFGADPQRMAVNHPAVPSVYPPLALWTWALLSSIWADPLLFRALSAACDAGVAWALASILAGRGRSLRGAWLYALMPLMAVESAGSGHLEPLALLPAALAVRAVDRGGTGISWAALGALVKLLPGVLFVSLARRSWPTAAAALALGLALSWPFLVDGPAVAEGLGTYAQRWSFNGALFPLLQAALELIGQGTLARPVAVGLGAGVCAWALAERRDPAALWLWVGGAFVLLSPTVHPWYLGWAWAPALLLGVRPWTTAAALIPLSYVVLATLDPVTGAWTERRWPALLIWGGLLLHTLAWGWGRLRAPARLGPAPARAAP